MNHTNTLKRDIILQMTTRKGDNSFTNSGSFCLDFFALCGMTRHDYEALNNLFIRSYCEDELLTLKIMLYLRDIPKGLGERNSFRMLFNYLSNINPNLARQLLPLIPKYGRWDDILSGMNTSIEEDVIDLIKKTLIDDLRKHSNNKEISLLSKWLPSINTSNKEARAIARKISNKLGYSYEEYRKILSKLRKGKIIENYLREKDYSINYYKIPLYAFRKYNRILIQRNYNSYRGLIRNMDPHKKDFDMAKLTTKIMKQERCKKENHGWSYYEDIIWKNAIPRQDFGAYTIVVKNGSTFMDRGEGLIRPVHIATKIAIYASEQLPYPFKHHFITYGKKPKLVKIPKGTLKEKIDSIKHFKLENIVDISMVYELLLKIAKNKSVQQKDMVEQILLITYLPFDDFVIGEEKLNTYKKKFKELGLLIPHLVYWNLKPIGEIKITYETRDSGIQVVNGSSQKIINNVISNSNNQKTYDQMIEVLSRYSEVDSFEM